MSSVERCSSVGLAANPAAQHIHQRAGLNSAKLTRIEELAVADRARLVPYLAGAAIEQTNHRLMAARTVDASLLVQTGARLRARRIEKVDALLHVNIGVLERVEPQPLTRSASIHLSLLDLQCCHRGAALGTLDLHGVPSARRVVMKTIGRARRATRVARPCAASPSDREVASNSTHDLRWFRRSVDPECVARLLEGRELAPEERGPGVMTASVREPLTKHRFLYAQIYESNILRGA